MSTPTQERIAEYHDLISRIAGVERSIRYAGFEPPELIAFDHERHQSRARELAELLNAEQSATYDVDVSVERWIETHPLAMTGAGMIRVIERSRKHGQTTAGNGVTVAVQIGDRYYPLHEGMFVYENGTLRLNLPDAVAEEFRQQGRRALQAEMRGLLNVARA